MLGQAIWLVSACAAHRMPNSTGATNVPCPPHPVAVRVFEGTGEPSVYANVRVEDARIGGVTGENGWVVLTGVPRDRFTLEAASAFWEPVRASVPGRPCGRGTVQMRFSTRTHAYDSKMAIPDKGHP